MDLNIALFDESLSTVLYIEDFIDAQQNVLLVFKKRH